MEELPDQSTYIALGAARIREIKALVSKLENSEHGGRAFQKLPRHMQRRTVSSNPKRLPRYLREKHMREGGGSVKPSHRPRRKYRRRPSNLLQEYNRRQREYVWLETHMWHAKRFHMRRQWGYALPDTPTCKGYRASLRAATKSCLLQDVSFYSCIEVEGAKTCVLPGLSEAMQPESIGILTSPQVLAGKHWMSFMFFSPRRQPFGALAEVDLMCHPPSLDTDYWAEYIKVWIWVHPSAYNQVVEALVEIFQLRKIHSVSCGGVVDLECTEETPGGLEEVCKSQKTEEDGCSTVELTVDCGVENDKSSKKSEAEEVCKRQDEDEKKGSPNMKLAVDCGEENHVCTDKSMRKSEAVPGDTMNIQEEEKKKKSQKSRKPKNVNEEKLQMRNVPFERTPKYTSDSKSVKMALLKDTLNRFRLLGPNSYAVLSSSFFPAVVEERMKVPDTEVSKEQWWEEYFGEDMEKLLHHKQQTASWRKLATCLHPPERVVLPLIVQDPRVSLPVKKMPLEGENADFCGDTELPEWPVESAMYRSDLRDLVTQTKEPDTVINQRRSQLLVPGSHLPETSEEALLPILLLSHPPTSVGLGSGWDIIAPAGWGMSVFLPLVFHGGVVGGHREAENLHLEALTPLPPHLLPDTPAGDHYAAWLATKRSTHFFRKPPASRQNFIKLGVQFPFHQAWRKLLQDWHSGLEDFFALRDSKLISYLSHQIENVSKITSKSVEKRKADDDNDNVGTQRTKRTKLEESEEKAFKAETDDRFEKLITEGDTRDEQLESLSYSCLVMVQLVLVHKGILEPCAMVCLPQKEDISPGDKLVKPSERGDTLVEPPHEDSKQELRAKMKEEHNKIKARMRRLKRKARVKATEVVTTAPGSQTLKEAIDDAVTQVNRKNEAILAKCASYKEEMDRTWLMTSSDPLQCCVRQIMGYITHGTFSQTRGRGAGIGWVALKPLLMFLQQCREVKDQKSNLCGLSKGKCGLPVLVRNPSTQQYRWARLSIITASCGV